MACIVLTAVAAAFFHLQMPIVTGKLINVISAGIQSASTSGLGQLNKPALQLFALLSGQGNESSWSISIRKKNFHLKL